MLLFSGLFFDFEHISYHVLEFLLLTLSLQCDLRSYRSFVSLSERTCAHFDLDAELNLLPVIELSFNNLPR